MASGPTPQAVQKESRSVRARADVSSRARFFAADLAVAVRAAGRTLTSTKTGAVAPCWHFVDEKWRRALLTQCAHELVSGNMGWIAAATHLSHRKILQHTLHALVAMVANARVGAPWIRCL